MKYDKQNCRCKNTQAAAIVYQVDAVLDPISSLALQVGVVAAVRVPAEAPLVMNGMGLRICTPIRTYDVNLYG